MKRIFPILFFAFSLFLFASPANGTELNNQKAMAPSPNERLVLNALKDIYSAEIFYYENMGAGEYGSLEDLGNAGLIDPVLASGFKYGFNISVIRRFGTLTFPPGFNALALPPKFGIRADGFVVNHFGVFSTISMNHREKIAERLKELGIN